MVNPCSKDDLPTPFEPVVSVNNIPVLEYLHSEFARPPYFSGYECLHLNDGYADGTLDPVDQVSGEPPAMGGRTLYLCHTQKMTFKTTKSNATVARNFLFGCYSTDLKL